jgi:hypothetical protein
VVSPDPCHNRLMTLESVMLTTMLSGARSANSGTMRQSMRSIIFY